MELQTFISETLLQIVRGISDAQTQLTSGEINPVFPTEGEMYTNSQGQGFRVRRHNLALLERLGVSETEYGEIAHQIRFDLAVTSELEQAATSGQTGSKEAGAKISVVSASISKDTESNRTLTTRDNRVSRIQFEVPVVYPKSVSKRP
jgi:hypothetical protein